MANTLPKPDDAYSFLLQEAHAKTFFQKLASYGWHPRTVEESQWMLETAAKLRVLHAEDRQKQASAKNNPFQAMSAHLDRVFEANGLPNGVKQAAAQSLDQSLRDAANMLANDPRFYDSVLSLKVAEAKNISAQLQLK